MALHKITDTDVNAAGNTTFDIDFGPTVSIAESMIETADSIKSLLTSINSELSSIGGNSWSSTKGTEAKSVCDNFTSSFEGVHSIITSIPDKARAAAKAMNEAENG